MVIESEYSPRLKPLPPIVRIVIAQATRWRAMGLIPESIFEAQISRLAREELEPKGLTLVVRDLPDGRTRFLVKKTATATVCEMMDFASDGKLEPEGEDVNGVSASHEWPAPA
jgi:hypothetical protein